MSARVGHATAVARSRAICFPSASEILPATRAAFASSELAEEAWPTAPTLPSKTALTCTIPACKIHTLMYVCNMLVKTATPRKRARERQAERSAAMRARLIAAAKASLLDSGYGRTTAVEVCARAGVTRGALFHHFSGLSELFAATLEEVCDGIGKRSREAAGRSDPRHAAAAYVETAWAGFGHPDFKIVIEVWLAARNDPSLRKELDPVIEHFRRAATPQLNVELAAKIGRNPDDVAFYRLALEAMIGMALGRAVAPGSKPMGHEGDVIALLKQLARARSKR